MSKKKLKTDGIFFTGESAVDVTGSQYLVKFGNYQCLLECGLHQSDTNSYLDSYRINSRKFKFNPAEIDYLFIAHPHIDHCGLVPRLVREGFHGKIITTRNTALVMKPLLFNSCYISSSEAASLSKKYKRKYEPLYDENDVMKALELIQIYDDYDRIIRLNESISFQWLRDSHCVGAAQLQLILSDRRKTRKILYTSDIGPIVSENHYLDNTEIPSMFNDVVIMESTYGDNRRSDRKKRSFDLKLFRSSIQTTLERGGNVLLPCFSFSRTQEILTTLYDMFGSDKNFQIPVIVDSKLSCEICSLYKKILSGYDLEYWNKVSHWKNVRFVYDKVDSRICLKDPSQKIVISSSGFCTNGRILNYLRKYLGDSRNTIIFTGYIGDNPSYLSYRIKHYETYKTLNINKTVVKNKADCISLSTFSSHANHNDLVKYGSLLNTNKLILVHGSEESKCSLANDLRESISDHDKTFSVQSSTKDMFVRL